MSAPHVTVSFGGVKPIVDLYLMLDGKIQGLIGPNGAGKPKFLNVLSGFCGARHRLYPIV